MPHSRCRAPECWRPFRFAIAALAIAIASGLVFLVADMRAARGYSRIYLGDAALQLAFAPTWIRRWGPPAR